MIESKDQMHPQEGNTKQAAGNRSAKLFSKLVEYTYITPSCSKKHGNVPKIAEKLHFKIRHCRMPPQGRAENI